MCSEVSRGFGLGAVRFVVTFRSDPGFVHERILLCKLTYSSGVVYTPGGDMYEEGAEDWDRVGRMVNDSYPPWADGHFVSFAEPIDEDGIWILRQQSWHLADLLQYEGLGAHYRSSMGGMENGSDQESEDKKISVAADQEGRAARAPQELNVATMHRGVC